MYRLQDGLGYFKIFISLQQPKEKITYAALKFTGLYPNVPVSLLLFWCWTRRHKGFLTLIIFFFPHCKMDTKPKPLVRSCMGCKYNINPPRHRAPATVAGFRGNCVLFKPLVPSAWGLYCIILQSSCFRLYSWLRSLPTRLKVDIWIQLLMSFICHSKFWWFRGDDTHCNSQQ